MLVALPESLVAGCDIPEIPERVTVGAMQELIIFLYLSLEVCSAEKADIRALQP